MNERLGAYFGLLLCLSGVLFFGKSAYDGVVLRRASSVPGKAYRVEEGRDALRTGMYSLAFVVVFMVGGVVLVRYIRNLEY